MVDHLVECGGAVEPAEREGEAGTGRRERAKAERSKHACGAGVPGFGMTNGSPACSARKASAFSSVVADTKHDLSLLAALADAVEGCACFLEGEDRVDCRGQLSSVCAASELDELARSGSTTKYVAPSASSAIETTLLPNPTALLSSSPPTVSKTRSGVSSSAAN